MKRSVAESKTRPPSWGSYFGGNSRAGGATSQILIPGAQVRQLGPRHGRAKSLLKLGQFLCLVLACGCLGIVVLGYTLARTFQAYQSWRFDRVIGNQPSAQKSLWIGWMDHAFSALRGEPAARHNQDTFQPHAASRDGRGSVPPVRALPTGSLVGRLEIPRIGMSVMVLEGDGDGVLQLAVGHVPATAFPGGPGNVVIAGHRDTFFRALREIRRDDEITFTTAQGIYSYRVGSIENVGPQDVQVLKPLGHPTLTLITCYPFDYIGPAPQRFIVQASETQSSRVGEPYQSLASARPTLDSNSGVPSTSSTGIRKARDNPSRSPSQSPPARMATTLPGVPQ